MVTHTIALDRAFSPAAARLANELELAVASIRGIVDEDVMLRVGETRKAAAMRINRLFDRSHGLLGEDGLFEQAARLVELRKRARREQALERKRLREARQAELEDQVYN